VKHVEYAALGVAAASQLLSVGVQYAKVAKPQRTQGIAFLAFPVTPWADGQWSCITTAPEFETGLNFLKPIGELRPSGLIRSETEVRRLHF
jgi:hypothetical protein